MLFFAIVIVTTFSLAGCSSGNEQASGPEVEGAPVGTVGAHEHGVVRMGLAVDGQRMSLNLEAPAATVFGFEHDPETEEEIALVSEAMEIIRTRVGEVIAVSSELACELEDVRFGDEPEGLFHAFRALQIQGHELPVSRGDVVLAGHHLLEGGGARTLNSDDAGAHAREHHAHEGRGPDGGAGGRGGKGVGGAAAKRRRGRWQAPEERQTHRVRGVGTVLVRPDSGGRRSGRLPPRL